MAEICIILLGESGAGKTSLLHRFKTGKFRKNQFPATLTPIDYHFGKIKVDGKEINLKLCDTAGTERFNSIARSYFREADGVMLLYDVMDMNSFFPLANWIDDLREINEEASILIVGNKNENPGRKAVNALTVKYFAEEKGLEYTQISVMTGENVEKAFQTLATKVILRKGLSFMMNGGLPRRGSDDTIKLSNQQNTTTQQSNSSCC